MAKAKDADQPSEDKKNDIMQAEAEVMELSKLKAAKYNPRKILPQKFKALKKSIEEFGILEPIVVNKQTDYTIVGGHMRFKAAQELGYQKIPCIVIDVDEEREKVLNLALNNIKGDFDRKKLQDVIRDVMNFELDLDLTGFRFDELQNLAGTTDEEEETEAEYPITPFFSEKYNYVHIVTGKQIGRAHV